MLQEMLHDAEFHFASGYLQGEPAGPAGTCDVTSGRCPCTSNYDVPEGNYDEAERAPRTVSAAPTYYALDWAAANDQLRRCCAVSPSASSAAAWALVP
jgi:hypothetical protein